MGSGAFEIEMNEVAFRNVRLTMLRENLEHIPQFALPDGFSLRWYVSGDDRAWFEIHLAADHYNQITPDLFEKQFGGDAMELSKRQCFVVDPYGQPIGTATAWFGNQPQTKELGRIHWVAILPKYQRRGLSKPLMTAVCERLVELGHHRAYLNTSSERKPALRLYLQFGFKPWIRSENEKMVWSQCLGQEMI
jgi:GNAT superfamily N-acetyltransferase